MSRKLMYFLWGGLFVVCAALGFVEEPEGLLAGLMTALGLMFFAPPLLLLRRSRDTGKLFDAVLVRNLSAASLVLILMGLVANVLSLMGSVALGDALHVVLGIVSTPMFCCRIWVLALFGWAFLMISGHKLVKKMKTQA